MKSHSLMAGTPWCFLVLASLALAPSLRAQTVPLPPRPVIEPAAPLSALAPGTPAAPPAPSAVKPPPVPDGGGSPWQTKTRGSPDDVGRVARDLELLRELKGPAFGYSGPQARRLLVIPGANVADDTIAALQEDLTIMATILDRTVHLNQEPWPDRLLGGVKLRPWRYDTGRELEAILIDGYGAIFLLEVDFPLIDTPTPEAKPAGSKTSHDTTWEKTRREILGQPGGDPETLQPQSVYDASRVNELEQRLKEALRHAGNLRGLTPEDWIIVQVTGRAPTQQVFQEAIGADSYRTGYVKLADSVMTLRVRKSAVDNFAADRMKLDDFVRDVKVSRRLEKPAASRP